MRAKRYEEVLEECLSAYLEGRRSIEESLSLYPSLRAFLEPLLETAAEIDDSFQAPLPPADARERSRRRFLAAAARRRARATVGPVGTPGLRLRWASFAGLAVVFLGAGLAGAIALSDDSGRDNPPATVRTLRSLKAAQDDLRDGEITPSAVRNLADTTSRLAAQVDDPESVSGLQQAIQDQFALLNGITDSQVRPEVEQALEVTEDLAARWEIDLPRDTPASSGSPGATPDKSVGPTPTVGPIDTAAPSGVPSPSVEP